MTPGDLVMRIVTNGIGLDSQSQQQVSIDTT